MSLFSSIELAPRDAVFGLNEQFATDLRANKVNLTIGVYQDENGQVPLLQCVRQAEQRLLQNPQPRQYLPMDGIATYDSQVQHLVFGADSAVVAQGRVATVQSLGGTGALRIGADFLRKFKLGQGVLVSNPTWSNHRGVFAQAGFDVASYRYCDDQRHQIDMDGMLADLRAAAPGTIVVLHACCHNPTGYDPSPAQWDQIVATLQERELVPFLDMAYQGFGNGLAEDGAAIVKFVASGMQFLVANSFSKSFSLYGERVGALSVVGSSKEETERLLSQLKILVRTNYSNPPTHGAAIVATVLSDPELRALWEDELAAMRSRIKAMRQQLTEGLVAAGVRQDMDFIMQQTGMFSYSGLNVEQMLRLRDEFAVYGLESGRFCVAALNSSNIDYVCQSVARVLQAQPAYP